jgi:hypothetical protein
LRWVDRKRSYAGLSRATPSGDALRNKCVCERAEVRAETGRCEHRRDGGYLENLLCRNRFRDQVNSTDLPIRDVPELPYFEGAGQKRETESYCAATTLVARGGVEPPTFRFSAVPVRLSYLTKSFELLSTRENQGEPERKGRIQGRLVDSSDCVSRKRRPMLDSILARPE